MNLDEVLEGSINVKFIDDGVCDEKGLGFGVDYEERTAATTCIRCTISNQSKIDEIDEIGKIGEYDEFNKYNNSFTK